MISSNNISKDKLLINSGRILDNNNAHEMEAILSQAAETGFNYVIINMSELEFLSSAGVGSILGNIELFREKEGDIIICNASATIIHILDMLDLTTFMTIAEDEQAASDICVTES